MIAAGVRVRLHGLLAKPELNGREGVCKERKADSGRWTVALDGNGGEVALKVSNLVLVPLTQQGKRPAVAVSTSAAAQQASAAPTPNETQGVVDGFDKMLAQLGTNRGSVSDAMVYCMENAPHHAEALATRLAASLGKAGLTTNAILARLFVVSDVLHNSGSKRQGASQYRVSLQELLPEVFENLGRVWLRKLEKQADRVRSEGAIRQVLKAWERWRAFPLLYTRGLECLIFMQISDITAREAGNEPDERLRQKVTRWFSGMTQAELPYACQQRGLAGKELPTVLCRARLCHFERYWHLQLGFKVRLHGLQAAPHLNSLVARCEQWDFAAGRWKVRLESGELKAVRQENLLFEEAGTAIGDGGSISSVGATAVAAASDSSLAPCPNADATARASPTAVSGAVADEGGCPGVSDTASIDGDPLSEEDLLEVATMEAAQAAQEARAVARSVAGYRSQKRLGTGTWTQVFEPAGGALVSPADCSEAWMQPEEGVWVSNNTRGVASRDDLRESAGSLLVGVTRQRGIRPFTYSCAVLKARKSMRGSKRRHDGR
eukprot:CAMPEP_0117511688 /NCGR_PEP_ID=MMETSP0784-20121206/28638_1 /TAXON_ID=39447 /ORGANISM="" /LENGTH=548 /DNA_ID=CAMNT_0005307371 /DNA_START=80 /DNA_END=1723 /DNA_ORIENTATION=+